MTSEVGVVGVASGSTLCKNTQLWRIMNLFDISRPLQRAEDGVLTTHK